MAVLSCLRKVAKMCGRFIMIIKKKTGIYFQKFETKQDDPEIDGMAQEKVSFLGMYVENPMMGTPIELSSKHLKVCSKKTDFFIAIHDGIKTKIASGTFGWKKIGGYNILYFTREMNENQEYFVSVQMAESQLLNYYLNYLHSCLYKWGSVISYLMTEQESYVLNELNTKISDENDGNYLFRGEKDYIIKLEDLEEFYIFIKNCYDKISYNDIPQKCGFLCIDGKKVVSYCTIDNKKFIPIFYFEEKSATSMIGIVKLEGWNLAYIQFCCTIQQDKLKYDVFSHDTCAVVSLGVIRMLYYSSDTIFEEYWPLEIVNNYLINHSTSGNKSSAWIIVPSPENEVTNGTEIPVNIPDQGMNVSQNRQLRYKNSLHRHYLSPNLYAELELKFIPKYEVMDGKYNQLYEVKKIFLNGIKSKSISFEPNSNDFMVILEELLLKYRLPRNVKRAAFICNKFLEMSLYFPNGQQLRVLDEKIFPGFNCIDTIILVKLKDVRKNIKQLNTMLRSSKIYYY